MLRLKCFAALSYILLLVGCAANGPLYQPAEAPKAGKALVYIYRPSALTYGARAAYFYINDKNVVDLNSDGYTYLYLDAGTYQFKQKWPVDILAKAIDFPVTIKANETYFFKFLPDSNICGFKSICFHWYLQQVPESAGKLEIAQRHYQMAK